jgi:uncharacterized membrane protein YeaQ/YmgE (transglycosylase-associated protein family)
MGIYAFLLVGLVVGLVARALVPANRGLTRIATALFGLTGAFLGGLFAAVFYGRRIFEMHSVGLIAGIMIAFTVFFLVGVRARARRGATLF